MSTLTPFSLSLGLFAVVYVSFSFLFHIFLRRTGGREETVGCSGRTGGRNTGGLRGVGTHGAAAGVGALSSGGRILMQ